MTTVDDAAGNQKGTDMIAFLSFAMLLEYPEQPSFDAFQD
jgi:hypothetical protein